MIAVTLIATASASEDANRSSLVQLRKASPEAKSISSDAERLRDPEWRWWYVERADWTDGSNVVGVEVNAGSDLRLTFQTDAFTRFRDGVPDTLAVYVEGRFLGVGQVKLVADERLLSLSGLRPPHVATIARALGAKGAMALGPRVSFALRSHQLNPGDVFAVDVYLSGVPGVAQYKLAIEVRKGLRGFLTLEHVSVDDKRPDFVFSGASSVRAEASADTATIEGKAGSPKVDPEVSRYLGTYVFRVSDSAKGTFTIRIAADRSELRDAAGGLIPFRPGGETILVTNQTTAPQHP